MYMSSQVFLLVESNASTRVHTCPNTEIDENALRRDLSDFVFVVRLGRQIRSSGPPLLGCDGAFEEDPLRVYSQGSSFPDTQS